MTLHLGDVPASSTLYIPFATYDSNGASVTMSGLAVTDIEIYKNGSVTQRSSDAGYTLLDTDGTDFDTITGIHGFSVDLSDNTDAGFYAVGSFYWVVVSSITVSTQTVNFIAATFRIVAAEAVTGKPKVDVDAWLGTAAATPTVAGVPEVDVTHFNGTAGTFASGRPEVNTSHIAGSAVSTASAQIGVNVVNAGGTDWASGSLTSGVFAAGAITASAIAADAIGASELAADAVAEIADAVWDEDATAHQTQGTFGQAIGDPVADTNTIYKAVVTDATGATVGVDAAAILDDTGTSGVVVASINANAITATSIAADAITDAKVAADVTIASVTGAVGSVTGAVGSIAAGGIASTSFAAGAINAAAIAADAIGASELAADAIAEIADGVWDEAQSGHTTAGTFGKYLDAQVSGAVAPTAAAVATAVVEKTLTEGYSTDGSAPTLQQCLFGIMQFLHEKSITGTTMTVKKLDGSTTAMTFTLSDAVNPTSVTRAS